VLEPVPGRVPVPGLESVPGRVPVPVWVMALEPVPGQRKNQESKYQVTP
jgi:hypothetical protein